MGGCAQKKADPGKVGFEWGYGGPFQLWMELRSTLGEEWTKF
jgi:hypothetical protein